MYVIWPVSQIAGEQVCGVCGRYANMMGREQAIDVLRNTAEGTFLVRASLNDTSNEQKFVLSVK